MQLLFISFFSPSFHKNSACHHRSHALSVYSNFTFFFSLSLSPQGARVDEPHCGRVWSLPVLPPHHGVHAEDRTRLALHLGYTDRSQHYQVMLKHTRMYRCIGASQTLSTNNPQMKLKMTFKLFLISHCERYLPLSKALSIKASLSK